MHNIEYVHSTPNGDDLIAYMARASNDDAKPGDPSAKLINYLIKHKHWSPFEMASMCVKIETTRSIAAQILRHRSFSFQEFSQRYAKVTKPAILPQLRRQDTKNRQNSIDDLDASTVQEFDVKMQSLFDLSQNLYNEMLKAGVAKECVRDILPLSTPTKLYMHGNLRSWIHYIDLRTDNGTQKEHMLIAKQCQQLVKQYFPAVASAVWD